MAQAATEVGGRQARIERQRGRNRRRPQHGGRGRPAPGRGCSNRARRRGPGTRRRERRRQLPRTDPGGTRRPPGRSSAKSRPVATAPPAESVGGPFVAAGASATGRGYSVPRPCAAPLRCAAGGVASPRAARCRRASTSSVAPPSNWTAAVSRTASACLRSASAWVGGAARRRRSAQRIARSRRSKAAAFTLYLIEMRADQLRGAFPKIAGTARPAGQPAPATGRRGRGGSAGSQPAHGGRPLPRPRGLELPRPPAGARSAAQGSRSMAARARPNASSASR